MRALTVDCVMFILRAASMKLPVSATIRKVCASAMSIRVDFPSPTTRRMMEIYLSKTSIGVSGKIRLATRAKIFTLTGLEHDSGGLMEGQNDEGQEGEEDRE